ncbi:hypothetical protein ACFWG5_27935 [Streptomyces hydrogenans]|uniref:hypothetical protein n=1 Tax=Streptomyces TaxID=1883 RepID=UPI00202DC721|nr:hypothetical protein [Streptomyces sp. G2]MCM1946150.1 hypothetical protein [Streptomyces sp. G2]
MVTDRFIKSAGMAFSAILLAAAPAVSGELPAGAGSVDGTADRIAADHGWGRNAAVVPASTDGRLVLAGGTGDHGWG